MVDFLPLVEKYPGGFFFRASFYQYKQECWISSHLIDVSHPRFFHQYPKNDDENHIFITIQEEIMSIVLMSDVLYLQLVNEFFPHKAKNNIKYTKKAFLNTLLAKFWPTRI